MHPCRLCDLPCPVSLCPGSAWRFAWAVTLPEQWEQGQGHALREDQNTAALQDCGHRPLPRIPKAAPHSLHMDHTNPGGCCWPRRHFLLLELGNCNWTSEATGQGAALSWAVPFLLPCSYPTAPAQGRGGQKRIQVLAGVTVTGEPDLQEQHTALDESRILGTRHSPTEKTVLRALGPLCSLSPNS